MSKITKEAMERGIKKKGVFETTDGTLYVNQNEAIAAQRVLDFDGWYKSNLLIADGGDLSHPGFEVIGEDLRNWLTDNKAEILRFLGV
jgi:hypothetical protein